jgi:carbamate kinase
LRQRVVVALGGNAILQRGQRGTADEQMKNVRATAEQIARMIEAGYEVIVTHGNGPQVGAILIQNELGVRQVPAMPMDVCGAESQGFIGYFFCQALTNALVSKKIIGTNPVCVVTQVLVDGNDPAFLNPTKPVGPFFEEGEARRRMAERQENWIEDSGRGWRRVVPSPDPKQIMERGAVKALVESGYVVVASGGGGVPVMKSADGSLAGVEAVIDKDLAAERLAHEVKADILLMLTDVRNVLVNYREPSEKALGKVTVSDLEKYQLEGHFKAGSMGPKVEAMLRFLKNGGKRAVIACLDEALEALEGDRGTQLTR